MYQYLPRVRLNTLQSMGAYILRRQIFNSSDAHSLQYFTAYILPTTYPQEMSEQA
jgi:hypothetical protein